MINIQVDDKHPDVKDFGQQHDVGEEILDWFHLQGMVRIWSYQKFIEHAEPLSWFTYRANRSGRQVFAFYDANKAMLFKLGWGSSST